MIKILLFSFLFTLNAYSQQTFNKLTVRDMVVNSQLNVSSTTKSSKPCPAMTEVQRDAIASPATGSCVYNSTTLSLNIYDGTLWQEAGGGGIENWLTSTAYEVDDVVIESNKIYQCEIAHTSGTFATDLAASKWVELSAQGNLSGVVNSTGLTTSFGTFNSSALSTALSDETGSGSSVFSNTPTLTTPEIGAATGASLTLSDKLVSAYQTPSNMLVNGDVELVSISAFTCTAGTCTRTTTSGEFSQGAAALKVALSAQAMNVSQTVNTASGIQKQGFARVIYKVPSTMVDFQVCTLVDAAEQTCVPSAKLVLDNTFRSIEIPLTFGSTSAGIKFKTTSAYTADAFFDGAILAQGLGLQNLQLDNVYSAQVTSAGVVSNENKEFITTTTATPASSVYTFALNAFTVTPNCWTTPTSNTGSSISAAVTSTSATSVSVKTNSSSAPTDFAFNLVCQKSGNDYLAASANVYSQASADYGWTAYTPTSPNSSLTISSTEAFYKRDGDDLLVRFKATRSGGTASEAQISLPPNLTSAGTDKIPSIQIAGMWTKGTSDSHKGGFVLIEPSKTYFTFGSEITIGGTAVSPDTKAAGTGVSGTPLYFTARIPIAGWSNSNVIVGSFENVPQVPGAGARIDEFDVTYAANSSLNSACTTGACYIDQIGTAATSFTYVSTGVYDLVTAKTYAKLKCQFRPYYGSQTLGTYSSNLGSCSNCNTLRFTSLIASSGAVTNSAGLLSCRGTY